MNPRWNGSLRKSQNYRVKLVENGFPLLTIAVAVYNTGKYLRECLDSVVNQTYQNLEIICVNDCSTDKSLEILEEYAAKDKRIKIINNEKNLGLGIVRNIGMDAAHGEYILFIDSDDWLDLTACEKLITKAKENDSDVVFYGAYQVNGNEKKELKNFCDVSCPLSLEDRKVLLKTTLHETWCKLWKMEFLKGKGIRFPDFRFFESQKPYWMMCLLAEKVAFERGYFYYYRRHKGQLTQCGDKRLTLVVDVYDDLERYLKREKIYALHRKRFLQLKFLQYQYAFLNLDIQFREEFLKKIRIPFSDKFFLLTQYKPLKCGVFLDTPFMDVLDKLRKLYSRCKKHIRER